MIPQARFSKSVKFFKNDFLKHWKLTDYRSKSDSCLFVGVYNTEDVRAINNHSGLKIVYATGRMRSCFMGIEPENVVVCIPKFLDYTPAKLKYKYSEGVFPIKDFSKFVPVPCGNKVYCYLGSQQYRDIMGYDTAQYIKKNCGFDVVYGFQGNTIDYVQDNYYSKCFVNLKPNPAGGFTTAIELAMMGRKTISNANAEFCIGYKNNAEIIDIIRQESQFIGQTRQSFVPDGFLLDSNWKDENFWL